MEPMSQSTSINQSNVSYMNISQQTTVPQNTPTSSPPPQNPIYDQETIFNMLEDVSGLDMSRFSLITEPNLDEIDDDFEDCEISANSTTIYESDVSQPAMLKRTSTKYPTKDVTKGDMSIDFHIDSDDEERAAKVCDLDVRDSANDSLLDDVLSLRCEKCGADLLNSACSVSNQNQTSLCFSCLCSI